MSNLSFPLSFLLGNRGPENLGSYTWANRPSASANAGKLFFCSDIAGGILLLSDGTIWRSPSNGPICLSKSAVGWLLPSLITANAATYSQTGTTITVTSIGHNIPASLFNGFKVYLDFSSGAAVDGWFSNFQYVDANTFTCVSSVSQTTSGGLNTNLAEITVTDLTLTIPGGLLGANGQIRTKTLTEGNNSANAKNVRTKLSATEFSNFSIASNLENVKDLTIFNRNSVSSQISIASAASNGNGSVSVATTKGTVDTSSDQTISVSLDLSTASEYMAISAHSVEVLP